MCIDSPINVSTNRHGPTRSMSVFASQKQYVLLALRVLESLQRYSYRQQRILK